jgi:hypothetical protein
MSNNAPDRESALVARSGPGPQRARLIIGRRPAAARILLVGPTYSFKGSRTPLLTSSASLMFYAVAPRLANGFIRSGHCVLMLNDRDCSKEALGLRAAGGWIADRKLLKMAKDFQPDVLCLQHCDLISAETVRRVREMVPHCRVAVVFYDNIFVPKEKARLRRFLQHADFGFVTTGGQTLAEFADACPVAFIPNPIDVSIDNARAYAESDKAFDVFCACGHSGAADRWTLIDKLRQLRPELRYALFGRDKRNPLLGDGYYRAIEQSKIGLNLSREERDLYGSDRMAQYLGNGILLAASRRSGYQRYFGNDEILFFDHVEELGDKIAWSVADDRRWRAMAQRARAKAAVLMDGSMVADFILRMTLGHAPPPAWPFMDHIFRDPARAAPVGHTATMTAPHQPGLQPVS